MTMDVQNNYQNYKEPSPDAKETSLNIESARSTQISKNEMQSTVHNTTKASKRSFDVAFLMMPDEKMRQKPPERQLRVSKQLFCTEEWEQPKKSTELFKHNSSAEALEEIEQDDARVRMNNVSPGFGSDINIDVGTDEYPSKSTYFSDSDTSERSRSRPNSNESAARQPKFLPEYKSKIFDDPTLISMQSRARYDSRYCEKTQDMSPRSAFTKVSNFTGRSPNPSVSPDNLLYQNSISPPLSASSPPTSSFNKATAFTNLITPAHLLNGNNFFKSQNVASPNYPEANLMPQRAPSFKAMEYQGKQIDAKSQQISPNKMNFLPFRPEIPYLQPGSSYPFGVQNFQQPTSDFMKFPVSPRESVSPLIANPAAAILSTLLPPTLAAFSLPAQNVCAKCSISFRMTSDLVYHMRTHHKSETTTDPNRRKREEKLKCPVCNESFRERHHLTRHMTAHQDKEGDMDDISPGGYSKKAKQFYPHNGSVLK
ncbi:zinc finger protein 488 [Battus philenor]|uniref:zinc finger protein 488 n=1 Tax=Battus philenor TaxID=42288 RepID=UPI0035CFB99A